MAAGDMENVDWWSATCELCTWRTRRKLDTRPEAIEAGHDHSQKKHPDSWSFRVRGMRDRGVVEELHGRVVDLLAQVLEYEHALEHVVQEGHHDPSACVGCQALARSALDGVNREEFTEMARDALSQQ